MRVSDRSAAVAADQIVPGNRAEASAELNVDYAPDEPRRSVAEQGVDTPGLIAPRVDGREGRPAVFFVATVEIEVQTLRGRAGPR